MTPETEITTCDKSSKAALASSDEKKPKMRKTAQGKKIILCDNPRVDMAPLTSSRKSKTTKGCPILLVPKRCLIIPKKESLPVDKEKFESLESKDSIFELIPSKTKRHKIDDADQEQVVTKDINVHIKALQKLITASFNFVRNYEFLIASAKEVLRLLDCFIKDTESPKFDWVSHRYVEGLRPQGTYTYPPDVSAYECNLAKGGRASVYPISPIFYEKSAPIDNGLVQLWCPINTPLHSLTVCSLSDDANGFNNFKNVHITPIQIKKPPNAFDNIVDKLNVRKKIPDYRCMEWMEDNRISVGIGRALHIFNTKLEVHEQYSLKKRNLIGGSKHIPVRRRAGDILYYKLIVTQPTRVRCLMFHITRHGGSLQAQAPIVLSGFGIYRLHDVLEIIKTIRHRSIQLSGILSTTIFFLVVQTKK